MGAIHTEYTFGATDTVTSTKLNNIIDQTTLTDEAVFNTTLAVEAGKLKINTQGVTSNELANNSVTTGKITDLSVSNIKIAANAVTTAKVLDANITPAKLSQPLTLGNSTPSTGTTSISFLSIPSWVKKISVIFSAFRTNGTSNLLIQLGDSGGIETTGYSSMGGDFNGNSAQILTGLVLNRINTSGAVFKGIVTLKLISGTTWISTGVLGYVDTTHGIIVANSAGEKTLSSALDRIKITTVGGVDIFYGGSVNIMYE